MTTMIAEVYDAFRDAGAGEEKARRAAEALAGHEDRFNKIESHIDRLEASLTQKMERGEASLRADIAAVRAEQVLMRWMMGTTLALVVAILVKLFIHN